MRTILCACAFAKLLPERTVSAIAQSVPEGDLLFADDLCRMSVQEPGRLAEFCRGRVRVFACRKRAAKALLERANANAEFEFFDLRNEADSISDALGLDLTQEGREHPKPKGDWPPWFPCIDTSRCISCGKCVDFCVFKVYSKTDDKIEVSQPQNCKNGCPACARMCPKGAIIFPKCPEAAISGGDGLPAATQENGGGFYEALKIRRSFAKSILKKRDS